MLLIFFILWGRQSPAQSRTELLQEALPHMIDSAGIPGLSVALIEDGNVTWSKGLGVKDKDTKEPVSDNTIFRGASLGKPIFAYAVLQLSEQGKIALDTPLEKYISAGILRGSFSKGRPDR